MIARDVDGKGWREMVAVVVGVVAVRASWLL